MEIYGNIDDNRFSSDMRSNKRWSSIDFISHLFPGIPIFQNSVYEDDDETSCRLMMGLCGVVQWSPNIKCGVGHSYSIQTLLQTAPIFTRIRFRFKFMNIIYRLFTNDDVDRCYSFTHGSGKVDSWWHFGLRVWWRCPFVRLSSGYSWWSFGPVRDEDLKLS